MPFNHNLYIQYVYKNTKVFIERSTISENQFNQMNQKVVVSVEVTVPPIKIKKIEPLKTAKKTRTSIRSNARQVLNNNVNDNNIETNVIKDQNSDKTPPKTLHPKRKLRSDSIKNDKKAKLEIKPIVENSIKSNLCKNDEKTNKENKSGDNQILSRVIGLPNMGNTCYINSVIQVLRITPGFKQFVCLLNKTIDSQINRLKSSNKKLVSTLHELFVHFGNNEINANKTNTSSTNESKINDLIDCEDFKNRFEFGQQQDCHEFLNWLINELNSYVEIINGKHNLKTNYNTRRKSNDFNKSFQNFNGVMVREIMCSECNKSSLLHDPFADIQIPLCVNEEVADICQLQSFEEIIHRKDYLKDENKFECHNCEKKTNASVVNSIQTLPKVLIIFLKKPFEYNQMTTRNVKPFKKLFRIPLKLEYKHNKRMIRYSLYALVIHNGSDVDNGHYYVIIDSGSVKTQNKKKGECSCAVNVLVNNGWIRVNDHKVSKLSNSYLNKLLDDQSIASTPYLAFYQRIN